MKMTEKNIPENGGRKSKGSETEQADRFEGQNKGRVTRICDPSRGEEDEMGPEKRAVSR